MVKISASPKRPFFLDFVSFFPFLYHFQVKIVTKHAFSSIFGCFLSLEQEVMHDSQSNSVNGNPFMEAGIRR